jgi:conjugative transfer signal peptidase TraF
MTRLGRMLSAGIVTSIVIGTAVAYVRINVTASMPVGLWLRQSAPKVVRVGDIVVFCLPRTALSERYVAGGFCENGLEPLFKPVAGIAGDVVAIADDSSMTVNGTALPNSAPLALDGRGRSLPHTLGSFVIPPGHILVVAGSPVSFDSRYFGTIPASLVRGAVSPLLVWK